MLESLFVALDSLCECMCVCVFLSWLIPPCPHWPPVPVSDSQFHLLQMATTHQPPHRILHHLRRRRKQSTRAHTTPACRHQLRLHHRYNWFSKLLNNPKFTFLFKFHSKVYILHNILPYWYSLSTFSVHSHIDAIYVMDSCSELKCVLMLSRCCHGRIFSVKCWCDCRSETSHCVHHKDHRSAELTEKSTTGGQGQNA